ncbi:Phosphotransferase enzyme family protein [Rathayibacter oskolensis]|uniref:Phosphotransferase enzyme family protein n=1 Tax=Rathayibacter oskolensis TaxID=1891671 RepID=A0A1X7NWX6_9MICO|nr:phosphotransferase [Rathayibacter oskolensis]SMH42904.1 Phosphotransferase enzyme family protein [Rathayibacter oskolensis]
MEDALQGGNTTAGVVRVGDTVRRPRSYRSSFIAALLQELQAAELGWAPRYLGVDERGRDSFAYVDGTTTDHPSQRDEAAYRSVGTMLRELHESTRTSPLASGGACVVHGDPGPYNVIVASGLPVALIDWDSAHAGDPLEDVGYAGWTWCVQSVGHIPVADQARRLRELVDGYGAAYAPDVVLTAVEAAQNRIIDAESTIVADTRSGARRRAHAAAAIEWARGDRTQLRRHRETFRIALDRDP